MSSIDAQIAEYRDKLLPSIELITARVQLLKSPTTVPENDFRKVLVEIMEKTAQNLSAYLDDYSNPTKYDAEKQRYEENPIDLVHMLVCDIRAPLATVYSAATLLSEAADDPELVSEPFTTTEKAYLDEIIRTAENINLIVDDVIHKISQTT